MCSFRRNLRDVRRIRGERNASYAKPVVAAYSPWKARSCAIPFLVHVRMDGMTFKRGNIASCVLHTSASCASVAPAGPKPSSRTAARTRPQPLPYDQCVTVASRCSVRSSLASMWNTFSIAFGRHPARRAIGQSHLEPLSERHQCGAGETGQQPRPNHAPDRRVPRHVMVPATDSAIASFAFAMRRRGRFGDK